MLLTRVDALLRTDHVRLAPDDECYFLREYIPRGGWKAGETNSLIANLKKSPSRRGLPDWRYKDQAIRTAASELREAINRAWLDGAILVPMPPSKDAQDPEYDDRMFQVASQVAVGTLASVRHLLRQRVGTGAYHHSDGARDVAPIIANMFVDYPSCVSRHPALNPTQLRRGEIRLLPAPRVLWIRRQTPWPTRRDTARN